MVGNGKAQAQALGQRGLHHAAVEGLAQAVGGNQAKAARLALHDQTGGAAPPVHDEIGALGHFLPCAAQRLHVAVAQRGAQRAGANKGRVAHDEIGLRPGGLARVEVLPLRHLRGLVGHLRAGHRVDFEGGAVPAAERLAVGAQCGLLRVPRQHGVAVLDVAPVMHHRLGHGLVALGADVPLQVTNPQHQLGHGGGALVQLNAQQLPGRDGFALQAQQHLRVAQRFELVDDLAFQALEVL